MPLRKRGNDLVGLCPFHAEKTPSFHVHPDRGFFKCFGCGAGGDVITFVQKLENVPFGDAVRMLAAQSGHRAGARESPRDARARSEREAIYEANRIAAALLRAHARGDARARRRAPTARERGLSAETIERSRLGYAPDSWSGLRRRTASATASTWRLAAKAGLVKERPTRLLRLLSRPLDGADVCDDRRSHRLRRPSDRRRRAEVSQHVDDAGLYQGQPSLRAQSRAPRRAARPHAHRRRRLSRLHRAASSRASKTPWRRWERRSPPSKRPNFENTPTTYISASTAMQPAAALQPKPSISRLGR